MHAQSPIPLAPGALLGGKYRLERQLGQGGMGVVFLAENLDIGRKVAIKILLATFASDQEMMTRFRMEARAAAAIGHPGIVDVLDMGTTPEGLAFIVMEHLQGETLGARLERAGPMPIDAVLWIGREALDAVGAAHDKGIVHRDLKPDNLFLADRPVQAVKVLDFGISKFRLGDDVAITRTGVVMGTPLYMSPEQARGAREIGPAADLYALGAILFHALTGRPPFLGESYNEVIAKVLTEPAPPLVQLRPDAPEKLAGLIDYMLAKRPEVRPPSARAVQGFLDTFAGCSSMPREVQGTIRRDLRVAHESPWAIPATGRRPPEPPSAVPGTEGALADTARRQEPLPSFPGTEDGLADTARRQEPAPGFPGSKDGLVETAKRPRLTPGGGVWVRPGEAPAPLAPATSGAPVPIARSRSRRWKIAMAVGGVVGLCFLLHGAPGSAPSPERRQRSLREVRAVKDARMQEVRAVKEVRVQDHDGFRFSVSGKADDEKVRIDGIPVLGSVELDSNGIHTSAPARPRLGTVRLKARPDEARWFREGARTPLCDESDCEIEEPLEAVIRYEARAEGYEPAREQVRIEDRTRVKVRLQRATAIAPPRPAAGPRLGPASPIPPPPGLPPVPPFLRAGAPSPPTPPSPPNAPADPFGAPPLNKKIDLSEETPKRQ